MSNIKKRILMVIVAVVVLTVALVACTGDFVPVKGGSPDAASESNSGYVVKQGEYYYYINGYNPSSNITEKKDNEFGKVTKGAIMRVKKNSDGTFAESEVVVPKMVYSANKDQGFSIFGEYLYYTSPSIATNKNGELQTSYTDFFRTKITGENNTTIATLASGVTKFKFTPDALIYEESGVLKRIDYSSKKTTTIVEGASNTIFPSSVTYKRGDAVTPDNYVYYTSIPENGTGSYNEVFAVTGNDEPIKLMGNGTFGENITMTITPKQMVVDADGVSALYFEKTNKTDGKSDGLGLFAISLPANMKTYAYSADKDKQMTATAGLAYTVISYQAGVIIDTADDVSKYFYVPVVTDGALDTAQTKKYRYPSTKTLSISSIKAIEGGYEMYYYESATYMKLQLKDGAFVENSVTAIIANVKTDWMPIEIINNQVFIQHSKYLTYVHTFNLDLLSAEGFDRLTGVDKSLVKFIGKMTEADKVAYEKLLETEAEADKK